MAWSHDYRVKSVVGTKFGELLIADTGLCNEILNNITKVV